MYQSILRAAGPREPGEDHRLGLLQAGGDDERLDSGHADPHGAGAVLGPLRRVGRRVRVRHPLLVRVRGPRASAGQLRAVHEQRHALERRETRCVAFLHFFTEYYNTSNMIMP